MKSPMNEWPLVSICCITYNHHHYIAQAIEGFLMQQVEFPLEIIIHDDASTDGTDNILRDYENKYPNLIRAIYQKENQRSKGVKIYSTHVLPFAKGKYIAMCEGDDYWIDPLKLTKQVDFLEMNPDYSVCFHAVDELQMRTGKVVSSPLNHGENLRTFTINQLAEGNLMHTPSVVYRNKLIEKLPLWFTQIEAGDYVLHMLNAKRGKIAYLPDTMAVYRRHNASAWSRIKYEKQTEAWIRMLQFLITEFDGDVQDTLKVQLKRHSAIYLKLLRQSGKTDAHLYALKDLFNNNPDFLNTWIELDYMDALAEIQKVPIGVKASLKHLLNQCLESLRSRI